MDVLTLTPAYGRDYPSADAARQAWATGADFQTDGGPYISVRELSELRARGIEWLNIRYLNLSRVTVVKVSA